MKFSDIFLTATLVKLANRPEHSGGDDDYSGCGCLAVIIMLIVGACIIFG